MTDVELPPTSPGSQRSYSPVEDQDLSSIHLLSTVAKPETEIPFTSRRSSKTDESLVQGRQRTASSISRRHSGSKNHSGSSSSTIVSGTSSSTSTLPSTPGETPAGSDLLPPVMPGFHRQKTVEEQKTESGGGLLPLLPSLRRQHSFPHTLRPVPVLEGNPKEYYTDVLRGMGFTDGEIEKALIDTDGKGIEDFVESIVAQREKKSVVAESPSTRLQSVTTDGEQKRLTDLEEKKSGEPITLELDVEPVSEDWYCRFCNHHLNTSSTETCVICNRARSECEDISESQHQRLKEHEETRLNDERTLAELYHKQQEELERLEQGSWPCKFCDQVNVPEVTDCRSCGSMKYLTRVLYTDEEWVIKLKSVEDDVKAKNEEDRAYRLEWETKKAAGGTVECLICFDDVPVKDMVFAECKHNFCLVCWNGYLMNKVKDGLVLKLNCPAPKCRRPVERSEIKARVDAETFDKFNRFYTQAQLSLNPNARWCPTPDCETVMFGSKLHSRLECPKCHHEICFKCNHDWHTGSCERAARGLVGLAADRAAFAAWAMVANVKPCPQCRAPIEKNEGCNHMTCPRCAYQFCWLCRGRYTSSHYQIWNLWGCPGAQFTDCLTFLGDDRCFCFDCGCGCGLLGKFKRLVLKLLLIACGAACCPCLFCFGIYSCFCD